MDGVPQKFITSFNDLLIETKGKGVPVVNYTSLNLEDEYFKDGDHLNLKGSKILYEEIRKDLKN
jgi:lysophospholipase L1-like esterase